MNQLRALHTSLRALLRTSSSARLALSVTTTKVAGARLCRVRLVVGPYSLRTDQQSRALIPAESLLPPARTAKQRSVRADKLDCEQDNDGDDEQSRVYYAQKRTGLEHSSGDAHRKNEEALGIELHIIPPWSGLINPGRNATDTSMLSNVCRSAASGELDAHFTPTYSPLVGCSGVLASFRK